MLAKRIIPCLDVTNGRVVKGVNFVELRDAGDPVEIAARYNEQGADELTFLDITASSDERDLILPIIEAVAAQVFIPLTVGGGVRAVEDVRRLLNAGADKISINTAAIQNPRLVSDASGRFGSQCIVVAIDARRTAPGRWEVFTHGGRTATGRDAIAWAREGAERIRNIQVRDVECDEVWSFIGKKEKRVRPQDDQNLGDCYTFVAIERSIAEDTLERLSRTQIKGRQFRMRMVG